LTKFNFEEESHRKKLLTNQAILIGNVGVEGERYIENARLYKHLDLYVKVLHTFHLPNVKTIYPNIDFVVIKDNLEGEYSGIEHEVYPGVFESIKTVTQKNCAR